jgi:UDP-glucose:(heptosyl)LPS alpha-1,3-glucosyltransferase
LSRGGKRATVGAMKIGLVRRGYSGTGGAEAYLFRFAAAARAAGHETLVFGSEEWRDADCEKVIIPGRTPREFADALRAADPRRSCDFLFSLERVWECDAYRAGDGVHAAWIERRAAFERWWKPLFRGFQRKHGEIVALERALFTGGAGKIIANSGMVRDEIIARFSTPAEKITVVHNGLPPWKDETGAREKGRLRLGIAPAQFVFLFTGSGWERKGLRYAIESLPQNALLLVAGHGKKRGLPVRENVRFLGPQTGAEVGELLAVADAFVLPTLYEPFSNACLEALAAGLPVITTTANGFAEIIEPGVEGEVVAPGDTTALADVLARWTDQERCLSVRSRLMEKGAQFSIERNVRETLAALLA